jgi:SAM-dependent methyltransferase
VADLSRRSGEVAELREDAPRKRGLGHRIAYNLDPLKSRFSPLAAHHARKTEAYYARCLTDKQLAEEFRHSYLPSNYRGDGGKTVLDYGCGRGRLCALLGQLGFRVVGADLHPHVYWRQIPNGHFVVLPKEGGAPFADSAFDCALHFGVLMYIREPELHLSELKKKLRSGGIISIQVANRECYRNLWAGRFGDAEFFRLYPKEELRVLLESVGFAIERVRYESFYAPVFPLAVNFVRRVLLARRFDLFDRDSLFVRVTPPRHRGTIHIIARAV